MRLIKKVSDIVNRINNETNITDFTFARGFNGILRINQSTVLIIMRCIIMKGA